MRAVEAIRADLRDARRDPMHRVVTGVYHGTPHTADAISRLLADVPLLLAELDAVRAEAAARKAFSDGLMQSLADHRCQT